MLHVHVHDFRKKIIYSNKEMKSVKRCTVKNKYDVFQHNIIGNELLLINFGAKFQR